MRERHGCARCYPVTRPPRDGLTERESKSLPVQKKFSRTTKSGTTVGLGRQRQVQQQPAVATRFASEEAAGSGGAAGYLSAQTEFDASVREAFNRCALTQSV